MVISFRNITKVNNNLRAEMFFDNIRAAELHCTPTEFDELFAALDYGAEYCKQGGKPYISEVTKEDIKR